MLISALADFANFLKSCQNVKKVAFLLVPPLESWKWPIFCVKLPLVKVPKIDKKSTFLQKWNFGNFLKNLKKNFQKKVFFSGIKNNVVYLQPKFLGVLKIPF